MTPCPDLTLPMLPYLDIHTHNLHAGPEAIINLPFGTQIPSEGAFSMGIHPWDSAEATSSQLELLAGIANHDRIVAIGECGLDALRGASLARQEEIFARHIEISEITGKPLIIHAVRTHGRVAELRRRYHPSQPWIIHGFRGKPQLARQLLASGCSISLGEHFNPEVPPIIPSEHLYAETDCSPLPISEIRARIGISQY